METMAPISTGRAYSPTNPGRAFLPPKGTILTPKQVADRLEEAFADTLKRLPRGDRPREHKVVWPDIVQNIMDAYGYTPLQVPEGPPSAAAISRLDECLGWLWMIEDRNRPLVVARAMGVKWHKLERRYRRKRTTLRRWWMECILTIARKA